MEYHGTGLPRGDGSRAFVAKVIATTLRLWLERHPVLGKRARTQPARGTLAAVAPSRSAPG